MENCAISTGASLEHISRLKKFLQRILFYRSSLWTMLLGRFGAFHRRYLFLHRQKHLPCALVRNTLDDSWLLFWLL